MDDGGRSGGGGDLVLLDFFGVKMSLFGSKIEIEIRIFLNIFL